MEKLHNQGRLGRFVVDEWWVVFMSQVNDICFFIQGRILIAILLFIFETCSHCACQWGHDFRPDYTKLGILKHHFPSVPVLAVTVSSPTRQLSKHFIELFY